MKQYLNAALVCFVCAALVIWLMGCGPAAKIFTSGLDTTTPAFAAIQDAHLRTYHLAAQVRGADRVSKADEVRRGERFFANCDTYSRTVADLLVTDYGADPAQVWLVQVDIPVVGFVWDQQPSGKWQRVKAEKHQVVLYRGMVSDNRWRPIVTAKDLEWEYKFVRKMNLQDLKWVAF
jgi:hypothetical protein